MQVQITLYQEPGGQKGNNKEDDTNNKFNFIQQKVVKKDVPGIMELYRRVMVPVWERYGRDYDLERVEENIIHNLDAKDYFLHVLRKTGSEPGSLPAGYIAWEKHRDHTSNHVVAHLRMIMVRPEDRRRGLASFMIEQFEAAAREKGCTKILFDVLTGSPANFLYDTLGYRQWSNYMEKHL